MSRKEDREMVLGNMVTALHLIQKSRDFAMIIPEIRTSLACATPWAKTPEDVAGIEGRIAPVEAYPRAAGLPAFGASTHMAHTILALRALDPEIGAAVNLKYDATLDPILRQFAEEKQTKFGMLDRNNAPPEPKYEQMGSGWRLRYMIDRIGGVPRIFYENTGMGKEALTIIVGQNAVEVTGMAIEIAKRYRQALEA